MLRASIVFLIMLVLLAGVLWYTGAPREEGIRFTDVASQAGLSIVTNNRAEGQYRLVETAGTGLALIDYDGDGWLDIFVGQGGELPGEVDPPKLECVLYRNNRDGTFTDVTQAAGLHFTVFAQGMAVGDFDGDGFNDLFVAGLERSTLFRNTGRGGFEDVTASAGVTVPGWATSCAFADFDGNGHLDLYVTRYLADTVVLGMPTVRCPTEVPGMPLYGYCPPFEHKPHGDLLFRNNGDGTFTDVSESAGLAAAAAPGLGVAVADLDGDRLLDVFVANDLKPNQLWRNLGDLKFEEVGHLAGVALGENGETRAGMGIAVGDYNGNALVDLLVTNFQEEPNNLYRQISPGVFDVATADAGLAMPSLRVLGFGTGFFDADNDGHLDLFVTNGHVNDYSAVGTAYEHPPQLFHNTGSGTFANISTSCGDYFKQKWVGRAVAMGDLNNDGATDLLVSHLWRNPALLRNDTTPRGHFVGLQLLADSPSRSPIGAVVTVHLADRTIHRTLYAGSSYLASSDPRLLVGLGAAVQVDLLEVRWPSGAQQRFENLTADRYYTLSEGDQPQPLEFQGPQGAAQ